MTSGLTQARSWQYHKLVIPKGSKAEVALAFDTGDPAVVESHRHRGTVILVATSADTGWTTWPIHKSYPPVMQEIVLLASAGRLSQRNVRVGQPFDRSFPAAGASAPVTVITPKRQSVATKLAGQRAASASSISSRPNCRRLPGQGRPAAGARHVVRRQYQPRRERSDQARPRRPGRNSAGLELRLFDELRKNWPKMQARWAARASCIARCSTAF